MKLTGIKSNVQNIHLNVDVLGITFNLKEGEILINISGDENSKSGLLGL